METTGRMRSCSILQYFTDWIAQRSWRSVYVLYKQVREKKKSCETIVGGSICLWVALPVCTAVWLSLNIFNIHLTSHSQNILDIDKTQEKALRSFTSADRCVRVWGVCSNCQVCMSEFKCWGGFFFTLPKRMMGTIFSLVRQGQVKLL